MRFLALVVLLLLFSSCSNRVSFTQRVDVASFRLVGSTIFGSPAKVTLKELHLDGGPLLGRSVIVHGELVSIGDHFSHLIMSDDTARMLVVLTEIISPESQFEDQDVTHVAILGTVERGKKGLPYIRAQAISPLRTPVSG